MHTIPWKVQNVNYHYFMTMVDTFHLTSPSIYSVPFVIVLLQSYFTWVAINQSFSPNFTINQSKSYNTQALIDRKFTIMSDVWAYGVLVYEIVTFGGTPYPEHKSVDIADLLQTGWVSLCTKTHKTLLWPLPTTHHTLGTHLST